MKVVVDQYIIGLDRAFPPEVEVLCLPPEAITAAAVKDADALFVRTRTHCNAELLNGSKVRFIATATIGYDHIDRNYCLQHNIYWTSAPGCNAQAVCDYIEDALRTIESWHSPSPHPVLGIIGVGHVGSKVNEMAQRKGYSTILSDPPLGLNEDVTKADIITIHTPLTTIGPHPTSRMIDNHFLSQLKPGTVIINAARGGIVDEEALAHHLAHGHLGGAIIDTWTDEPNISPSLTRLLNTNKPILATYHIAGYSLEGKINASNQCLEAFSRFFGLKVWLIENKTVSLQSDSAPGWVARVSAQLCARPNEFESLRKNYPLR